MTRLRSVLSIALFSLCATASAACQRQSAVRFDTPAQRMDQALQDFAHKTGCPITIDLDLTRGKQVAAVPGRHLPAEALHLMLRRSGLQFTASREGYAVGPWRP